jgi:competence protein ComEC
MLKKANAEIVKAEKAMKFDLGNGATVEILYAFDGVNTPVGGTDINDLSLVMMLKQNKKKILFTGDLNNAIGQYLAKNAHNLEADILKVPHHGTEGVVPNSFFEVVNAKFALVPAPTHLWCQERSARIRNWFNNNGVPVYVNGWHGNVQV